MLALTFASKCLRIKERRRDVFQAIADPTRRAIIHMIAREPTNVNAIAEQFDVSRQAISLHLKILIECGLLHVEQKGRERICEAQLDSLSEVNEWVLQYKKFWTGKLDGLEDYLNTVSNDKKHKHGKNDKKGRK